MKRVEKLTLFSQQKMLCAAQILPTVQQAETSAGFLGKTDDTHIALSFPSLVAAKLLL